MLPAVCLLIVCTLTCNGLLAVWAATSSRHWFLRAATVLAPCALLLVVPAYEPWLVLTMQCATVAGASVISKWFRKHRREEKADSGWRFGMQDLLLATILVAYAVAVGTRIHHSDPQGLGIVDGAWFMIMLQGAALGLISVIAWQIARARGTKLVLFLFLGFFGSVILALPAAFGDVIVESVVAYYGLDFTDVFLGGNTIQTLGMKIAVFFSNQSTHIWIAIAAVQFTLTALILWLVSAKREFAARSRHVLVFAMVLGLSYFPAKVYWHIATPPPIPKVQYPEPNGYLRLIELAKQTEKATINSFNYDPDNATSAEREQASAEVADVVAQARDALLLPALIPIEYDAENDLADIQALRSLARAFSEVADVHAMNGRWEEACETYLDLVDCGERISGGGLIIDDLVGIACSGIGMHGLYEIHKNLPVEQRNESIGRLSEYLKSREPIEQYVERDRIWEVHTYGWVGGLLVYLQHFEEADALWSIESYSTARKREVLQASMLQAVLAIENFRSRHNRLPESLDDLTLNGVVLVDPFAPNGSTLRYRKLELGSYLLYSVGSNGIDDKGQYHLEDAYGHEGDITLELLFERDHLEAEAMAKEQAELDALEQEVEEDLEEFAPQADEIIEPEDSNTNEKQP